MVEPDDERAAADLRVALGRIVRRLRQAHRPGELTLSEVSVLSRLDRDGPATPGALAAGERVRPQAMGATLAALEQRGLVARMPDPDDGRRVSMSADRRGPAAAARPALGDHAPDDARAGRGVHARGAPPARSTVIPLLDRLADRL